MNPRETAFARSFPDPADEKPADPIVEILERLSEAVQRSGDYWSGECCGCATRATGLVAEAIADVVRDLKTPEAAK